MSKLNNRYPKKDQSYLKDGSKITSKYNPKKEESPKAWDEFLSQEKYKDISQSSKSNKVNKKS